MSTSKEDQNLFFDVEKLKCLGKYSKMRLRKKCLYRFGTSNILLLSAEDLNEIEEINSEMLESIRLELANNGMTLKNEEITEEMEIELELSKTSVKHLIDYIRNTKRKKEQKSVVVTIEELKKLSKEEIMAINGIGKKTFNKIYQELANRGIFICSDKLTIEKEELKEELKEKLKSNKNSTIFIIKYLRMKKIKNGELPEHIHISIEDVLSLSKEELYSIKGIGKERLKYVWKRIEEIKEKRQLEDNNTKLI